MTRMIGRIPEVIGLILAIHMLPFQHQDFKDWKQGRQRVLCCFGEGSEVRIAWNETTI
ncbi:unnamed protein product [Arabidopsis halleri]